MFKGPKSRIGQEVTGLHITFTALRISRHFQHHGPGYFLRYCPATADVYMARDRFFFSTGREEGLGHLDGCGPRDDRISRALLSIAMLQATYDCDLQIENPPLGFLLSCADGQVLQFGLQKQPSSGGMVSNNFCTLRNFEFKIQSLPRRWSCLQNTTFIVETFVLFS